MMVNDMVTAIGRPDFSTRTEMKLPSGMNATLTDTTDTIKPDTVRKSGWSTRSHAAQTIMTAIETVKTAEMMTRTNRRISFCSVVRPILRFEESFAIFPKTVLSPVKMQIPIPEPETQ